MSKKTVYKTWRLASLGIRLQLANTCLESQTDMCIARADVSMRKGIFCRAASQDRIVYWKVFLHGPAAHVTFIVGSVPLPAEPEAPL